MGAGTNLWRHADFLKLWSATSVSHFGTMFGALGLTAIIFLEASPSQLGVLAAASGLPVLVFSVVAGVWVDRLPRRRVMILADCGRTALLLTVPAAALLGQLRVELLYLVAFGVGFLGVFFDLSYRAVLPGLVERNDLVDANSKLQMSESVAESVSPAAGGAVVQALGGPAAVFVDAMTFVASGALVAAIRGREPRRAEYTTRSVLAEAREGMGVVGRDRVLRAFAGTAGTGRFFGGFFLALYGIWVVRELEFTPVVLGVLVGAGGVGSFFGAAVVGKLSRRFGLGPLMVWSRFGSGLAAPLTPLAGGPAWLAFGLLLAGQLIGDFLAVVYEVNAMSLRQAITPGRLLGRVNATIHLLSDGMQPLGALVAGFLALAVGVQAALFIASAGMIADVLWLLFSPVPTIREQPQEALN
jgi:MFS family permease